MDQESHSTEPLKSPRPTLEWNDILRVVGSIAGFVGIASALLWLFGRFYYSGFFTAFGFPSLLISLAPEDYLEKGSSRLIYFIIDILIGILLYYLAYLSKILYQEKIRNRIKNRLINVALILLVFASSTLGGVFLISTKGLGIFISYFFENPVNIFAIFIIFFGLEVTFLIASPRDDPQDYQQLQSKFVISPQTPIAVARILVLVVMFASLLTTQASASFTSGQGAGCLTTLRKSISVVIFSKDSILNEGQTQTKDLYVYEDYYLLFTDKNNYYLFREINPESYEPESYFIVNKDVLKTVQLTQQSSTNEDSEKYNRMCVEKINE
jgi:hypothetical protein